MGGRFLSYNQCWEQCDWPNEVPELIHVMYMGMEVGSMKSSSSGNMLGCGKFRGSKTIVVHDLLFLESFCHDQDHCHHDRDQNSTVVDCSNSDQRVDFDFLERFQQGFGKIDPPTQVYR